MQEKKYVLAMELLIKDTGVWIFYNEEMDERVSSSPTLFDKEEEAERVRQSIITEVHAMIDIYTRNNTFESNTKITYIAPGTRLPMLITLSAIDRLYTINAAVHGQPLLMDYVTEILKLNDYWMAIGLATMDKSKVNTMET